MFTAPSIIRTAIASLLLTSVAGASAAAAEPEPMSSAQASLAPASECRAAATVSPDDRSPSPPGDPSSVAVAVLPLVTPCVPEELTSTEGDGVALTIEAGDLWFGPDELTISSQGTTTITLTDVGVAVHNLTVDELDLQVVAAPGRSSQVLIVAPAPGTYQFYCSVSGHRAAGMVGTLIVE
jgi:plastocyanin